MAVVAKFVDHKQREYKARSNAQSESTNIDDRIKLLLHVISERNDEVAFKHSLAVGMDNLFLYFMETCRVTECFYDRAICIGETFPTFHF